MADNVTADAGAGGEVFATDQRVSDSVHFPLTKVYFGALNTFTPVSTASGGPLPVQLRLNAGTVIGDVTTPIRVDTTGTTTQPVSGTVTAAAQPGVDLGDVDILSIIPGTAAANLGKAEDAVHADGDTGVMSLAVRRDADTALAGTTGDYAPLQVNALGALKVAEASSFAKESTAGLTDSGSPALVVTQSADALLGSTGNLDYTQLQVDATGYLKVNVKAGSAAATEFAQGDAHSAAGSGIAALVVRQDSGAALTGVDDGDWSALQTDSVGNLRVNVAAGSATGTEFTQGAAHNTTGDGPAAIVMRQDADAILTGVADAEWTVLQVGSTGALKVTGDAAGSLTVDGSVTLGANSGVDVGDVDVLSVAGVVTVDGSGVIQPVSNADITTIAGAVTGTEMQVDIVAALPAGTAAIGKLAANSGVDIGDVDVTSVIPGTGATNLGKAEDETHTSGDTGVMPLAVRQDADTGLGAGVSQYSPLIVSSTGALKVTGDTSGVLSVSHAALTELGAAIRPEDDPHVSADKGIMPLAVRLAADTPLSGADGDYEPLHTDATGALKVTGDNGGSLTVDNADITAIAAAVATEGSALGSGVLLQGDDGTDRTNLLVDTDGHLQVDIMAGGGGGIQYAEADAAATVTGTAIMWEATADTMQTVNAATPLPVDGSNVIQPVSGTVTANLGTIADVATETTLATINTAVELIDDAVHAENAALSKAIAIAGELDDTGPTAATEDGVAAVRITPERALHVELRTVNGTTGTTANPLNVSGSTAHDAADGSTQPLKVGARAISHGADPTPVAASDRTNLYANRAGILFTMGGHPNVVTRQVNYTAGDGAQTDTVILEGAANERVVITRILVACANANTVDVACRIGFGETTTPANDAIGVVADHPGIPPGGGFNTGDGSGMLGVGGAAEDIFVTTTVATGGSISVTLTYYVIVEA